MAKDVYTPPALARAGSNAHPTTGVIAMWGAFHFDQVTDVDVNYGSMDVVRVFSDRSNLNPYAHPFLDEQVYVGTRSRPVISFTGFQPWIDEGSIGQRHELTLTMSPGILKSQAILIDARRAGSTNNVWRWSVTFQAVQT